MRTVLITGGSRGIGAAMVRAFCAAGYRAAFLYRSREDAARALAEETGAYAIRCDVRSSAEVNAACAEAKRLLSHIDVLINNAGIARQTLLTDMTDADWHDMLDTHLSGAFYTCRAVLPQMISRRSGRIINISSIWGEVGASCEAAYSAAKAGLIGLTKALAKEAGPSGVTVNAICPGVIETDMLACFTDDDLEALRQDISAGRLGTPEDIARCALFLADEASSFVNGLIMSVNGG